MIKEIEFTDLDANNLTVWVTPDKDLEIDFRIECRETILTKKQAVKLAMFILERYCND